MVPNGMFMDTPGNWAFPVNSVRVGGMVVCSDSCTAIADTGTSFIVGPSDQIALLADSIGAVFDPIIQSFMLITPNPNDLPSIRLINSHFF